MLVEVRDFSSPFGLSYRTDLHSHRSNCDFWDARMVKSSFKERPCHWYMIATCKRNDRETLMANPTRQQAVHIWILNPPGWIDALIWLHGTYCCTVLAYPMVGVPQESIYSFQLEVTSEQLRLILFQMRFRKISSYTAIGATHTKMSSHLDHGVKLSLARVQLWQRVVFRGSNVAELGLEG